MVQGSYEILPMLQEYGSVAVKLYLLRKPVDQSVLIVWPFPVFQ